MLIVLSEASEQMEPSASARDIRASTEAARLVGCRVFTIPPDFERCETAENALFHVPAQSVEAPAVWTGYIPTAARYEAIYDAALSKGIHLVNTPHQHLDAQEFDRAYVLLGDLTPQSVTVTDITQVRDAARQLQFPVFLKGTVQSRKSRGWKACVATNEEEAERLASQLFSLENRSRGRVVLRRFVRLRYARTAPGTDFPLGREYRVFTINGRIAGQGYYLGGRRPAVVANPFRRPSRAPVGGRGSTPRWDTLYRGGHRAVGEWQVDRDRDG